MFGRAPKVMPAQDDVDSVKRLLREMPPLKMTDTLSGPRGRPAGDPSRVRPCALQRNARGPRADGYQLAITIPLSITKTLPGKTVTGTRWPTMPALAGVMPTRMHAVKRAWQPQKPSVFARQHSTSAPAERVGG